MANIIDWKIKENIGHLILDDPPSNKMTKTFFLKLNDLISNIMPHSGIKALLIYGSGRHFSAGADVDSLLKTVLEEIHFDKSDNIIDNSIFLTNNNKTFLALENLNIPIIACINGVCLGSALELALFAHIRICSPTSLFGFPETGFNIIPGLGGTQKILKSIKYSKALELILKGDNFNSEEALKWNIIHKIVPKKELIDTGIQIAAELINDEKKQKLFQYINKNFNNHGVFNE